MATLTINGKEVTVEDGTPILRAAGKLGVKIPHYCYHPAMSAPANCRICLVEVEGRLKLEASCRNACGCRPCCFDDFYRSRAIIPSAFSRTCLLSCSSA